jgi:hypothetical protein
MVQPQRANYAFTRVSSNKKTGPLATTMTDRRSCPESCGFKGNGCYAENFPLVIHWDRLTDQGMGIDDLSLNIKALPKGHGLRINQAGDFHHNDGVIDSHDLEALVDASSRVETIAYTHHDPLDFTNHDLILGANKAGFAINISAETLLAADFYADLAIAPVVVAVPRGTPKVTFTPKGRQVTLCPAVYSDMTCDRCMICAKPERKAIVAFEAHGSRAAKVERIFFHKHIPT